MNILAAENIEAEFVQWLRREGFDVAWVVESNPGASDEWVIATANESGRILITSDRDFGEQVFRLGRQVTGVLFLRLPEGSVSMRLSLFIAAWPQVSKVVSGHFVVLAEFKYRVRPLPD